MASLRHGKDKHLNHLKQESKKLHAEVEALEDALLLHQRYRQEDDSSVRGILRKEIGGSRWQHGGQGKLKSYKNSKDLEDPDKSSLSKTRRRRNRQDEHQSQLNTTSSMPSAAASNQNDLVSKPLKGSSNNKVVNSALNSEAKIKGVNQGTNKVKEKKDQYKDTSKKNDLKVDSKFDEVDRVTALKNKVLKRASAGVIPRNPKQPTTNGNRPVIMATEVKEFTKNSPLHVPRQDSFPKNHLSEDDETLQHVKFSESTRKNFNDEDNYKKEERLGNKPPTSKSKQTNIKPSQALERSRDNEVFKILSLPSNSQTSQTSKNFLHDSSHSQEEQKSSPKMAKCDPLVRNWIKSLGLLEEEKYLNLFADNEIDMAEISQLTALQLNEMGITAFGALNKILRGIKNLRKDSHPESQKSSDANSSSRDSNKILNTSLDGRQSKTMESLNKSLTFEERLNDINQYRTSLRRSRSFASSASKALYSSSNVRSSLDDWAMSGKKEEPIKSADSGISLTRSDDSRKNDFSKTSENDKMKVTYDSTNVSSNVTCTTLASKQASIENKKCEKENLSDRVEKKIKSLRTRSSSPARPASSPTKRRTKQPEKTQDGTQKRKVDHEKDGSDKTVKKKSLDRQNSASVKAKKGPVLWPRAKSAQQADKKAKEAVAAAAKKFNEKQKQLTEKEDKFIKAQKLKKAQRDEMAARHELRLQNGSDYGSQEHLLDEEDYEMEHPDLSDLERDINNLISVTVLDRNYKSDYKEEKRVVDDQSVERARPQTAGYVRQSIHNPVYLDADFSDIRPNSRHEVSRRNEVKTIEAQIEALQSKALSGEMVTMDLVKDLQLRLEELEHKIKDSKPPKLRPRRSDHRVSKKGKDTITVETDFKVDARLVRLPIEGGSGDPLRSIEIDSDDIMYDYTDLIGEGTFCKVYHGVCIGKEVAIKQLKIPLTSHDKNYFAAEVSLLKELHHARVVQLLGVCTSDKYPVMVLEFMARGSLYYYLHDPKCASMDHAEYYGVSHDIALGMNYLHQHKPQVLHLDLKSMNVLLDSSGRAKVADFGFSKFRHDADMRASKASRKKGTGGSPKWMAPELLETGEITAKADVYSFGIILWEMLTRCHPYDGCSVFQILERVRLNKRPEIPSSCPPDLSDLIQRCWHQNPARRPPFKDIISQLDKLAFPPDWRALFKEAGVPSEALEDVQSARTIISLVNNTLDLENVKSMMEDIKHSDDAIMESHDLTKKSHDFTRRSHDSSQLKHFSEMPVSETSSVFVQTRNPQRDYKSSLKWSHDQNFEMRNENSSNSNVRSSVDLASSEKNISETSRTEDKHAQVEDTTTEYLNYLKASCDILSPTIRSPSTRKQSQLHELISSELNKPEDVGAVIETYSSIPPSTSDFNSSSSIRTSLTKTEMSDKKEREMKQEALEKEIKETKAELEKQLKKDLQTNTDSSKEMKKETLEKEIKTKAELERKLKKDLRTRTDLSKETNQEALEKEIKTTKIELQEKLKKDLQTKTDTFEVTTPKSVRNSTPALPNLLQEEIKKVKTKNENIPQGLKPDQSKPAKIPPPTSSYQEKQEEKIATKLKSSADENKSFDMRKSQDLLLKEMLNSKAYSRRDICTSQSADQSRPKSSEVRKSHDNKIVENERRKEKPEILSKSFDSSKILSEKASKKDKTFNSKLSDTLSNSGRNSEKSKTDVKQKTDLKQSTNTENKEKVIVDGDRDNSKSAFKNDQKIILNVKDSKSTTSKPKVPNVAVVDSASKAVDKSEDKLQPNDRKMRTSLSGNVLNEIKTLHTKLRSEKTGNVQEIKSLHSKLRTGKVEKTKEEVTKPEVKVQEGKRDNKSCVKFEKDSVEVLDFKDDFDKILDMGDDLDSYSVDSLDLNDSITDDIDPDIVSSRSAKSNKESSKKGDKSQANSNENQNASAVPLPETQNTGKIAKDLPNLRLSLNTEIANFSLNKHKAKKPKSKEDKNNEQGMKSKKPDKEELSNGGKPKKRDKSKTVKDVPLVDKSAEPKTNSKEIRDSPRTKLPGKSIEAWVEERPVVDSSREKQRKVSTSSLPQRPPPIVIPDEPYIPPAPPLPVVSDITKPSLIHESSTGETIKKDIEVSEGETTHNEKKGQVVSGETKSKNVCKGDKSNSKKVKMDIPEAKVSSKEAQISNLSTQSEGDGQLVLKSADLRDQKEVLQSISKPHPNQLQDLSQINKQAYSSIAEILKRAVFNRREAMGEDSPSPSVASSWSFVDD